MGAFVVALGCAAFSGGCGIFRSHARFAPRAQQEEKREGSFLWLRWDARRSPAVAASSAVTPASHQEHNRRKRGKGAFCGCAGMRGVLRRLRHLPQSRPLRTKSTTGGKEGRELFVVALGCAAFSGGLRHLPQSRPLRTKSTTGGKEGRELFVVALGCGASAWLRHLSQHARFAPKILRPQNSADIRVAGGARCHRRLKTRDWKRDGIFRKQKCLPSSCLVLRAGAAAIRPAASGTHAVSVSSKQEPGRETVLSGNKIASLPCDLAGGGAADVSAAVAGTLSRVKQESGRETVFFRKQ